MIDQHHTIHTDDIDDWIETLRGGSFWGHQMDTVARAILETMAHSEHSYTGATLAQVIRSPLRRREFITTERDSRTQRDNRRLRHLITADDSTYSLLAKRIETG
jgi:Arc/MetJ family transcription regulator